MNELAPASQWILQRFLELRKNMELHLQDYEISHSVDGFESFLWEDFASWYVEYLKTDPSQMAFAKELFKQYIVLISPYLPFESQALWDEFFGEKNLVVDQQIDLEWGGDMHQNQSSEFELIKTSVERLRSLRGLFAIDPAKKIQIFSDSKVLRDYQEYLSFVAKADLKVETNTSLYEIKINDDIKIGVEILEYIADKEAEKVRTNKQIDSLLKQIEGLKKKLSNQKFLENADSEIIQESRSNLAQRELELSNQQEKLEILN